jgi:alkane 1-monooxygenase
VRWWALQLLGTAALFVVSPLLGAFFVAQAALSVLLLEIINYVEHYGLARASTGPGRWERVLPRHSWNSPERVTNWFLLNLQRHSDHHAFAGRPYEQLRHYEDVPQLPAGYPWMMLVALVPPVWFRVMDARVEGWKRSVAA